MINRIKTMVAAAKSDAVFIRRHLHRHPELSFQEYETSRYIKSTLQSYGIAFETVADTGVIARVEGTLSPSEHTVILRADMDALPIQEENVTEFTSQNAGVMHACGHDFHTANLLSVLKILAQLRNEFSGVVIGVFQPAEEKIPGGALSVLASKKLPALSENIRGVIGLHVSPELESGKIGIKAGRFMASSDEIFVTIKGKGGHGAQPHQNIDPVVISAQLILSLQQIVSRTANPATPSVLSFGRVWADGATNVIPNSVYIEGTFRTMDEKWRHHALELIEKQIVELPKIYGAEANVEIRRGYPVLMNDTTLTTKVSSLITEYGHPELLEQVDIWMAAEDFAYYSHVYPSVFYLVGVRNAEKGYTSALHTPTFQIDEDAFEQAMGSMLYTALKLLEQR